jgi:hypothetical protein
MAERLAPFLVLELLGVLYADMLCWAAIMMSPRVSTTASRFPANGIFIPAAPEILQ